MCYSKIAPEKMEKLRTNMINGVNEFCDGLEGKGKNQVRLELEKMEDQVNKDLLDVVEAECQNNNQESAPLVLKEVQEFRRRNRCREQRPSGLDLETESPAAQQDEEICEMACMLFQEMLQRLMEIWVKEMMATLCSAMKSVWNMIESFFSSVAQFFQSFL